MVDRSNETRLNITKEDYISIEADKPVFVLQYVVTHLIQGNCAEDCGVPVVLTVPPMQRKEHQLVFSTSSAAEKHNVNLVIATPLRDGILLNGSDLLSFINSSISVSDKSPAWNNILSEDSYSAIQFSAPPGLHRITHNSSKAYIAATSVPNFQDTTNKVSSDAQELTSDKNSQFPKQNTAVPTVTFEKAKSHDEINNAYLDKTETDSSSSEEISPSVIAVLISLCSAVLFVIICIAGFVFAEFAFHNGERSLFPLSRVAPYEPIED